MGKKRYSICKVCNQEMVIGGECKLECFECDGKTYARIPAGFDGDGDVMMDEKEICHDCNAGFGKYHHLGCDMEYCPVCGRQLLGCECNISYVIEE